MMSPRRKLSVRTVVSPPESGVYESGVNRSSSGSRRSGRERFSFFTARHRVVIQRLTHQKREVPMVATFPLLRYATRARTGRTRRSERVRGNGTVAGSAESRETATTQPAQPNSPILTTQQKNEKTEAVAS